MFLWNALSPGSHYSDKDPVCTLSSVDTYLFSNTEMSFFSLASVLNLCVLSSSLNVTYYTFQFKLDDPYDQVKIINYLIQYSTVQYNFSHLEMAVKEITS